MTWLVMSLNIMATLEFQAIASIFLSFSSPPTALITLSSTALGSMSSAQTRLAVADTNMIAKAARRNRFMKIASLVRGSCLTRRGRIRAPDRAVGVSGADLR